MTADHPNAEFLAFYYGAVAGLTNDAGLTAEEREAKVQEVIGRFLACLSPTFSIHTAGNELAATGGLPFAMAMGRRRGVLSGGTFRPVELTEIVADDHYGLVRGVFRAERGDAVLDVDGMGLWRFVDGKAAEHWETAPGDEWDEFFLGGDPGFTGTAEEFWSKVGRRRGSVLISGASIAGPTLAYWLRRYGYEVTVVERAPSVRGGGYPVDIRGTAVDVVERMGILPDIQARHIDTRKATFFDASGVAITSLRPEAFTGGVEGRDYELPRGDLASILWGLTRDDVEYVFDDSITSIEQRDDAVDVTFERAPKRTFDYVFGADGLHSNVRRLVFGPESQFDRYLGWCFAGFTLPNHLDMEHEATMYNVPGRLASLYAVGPRPERLNAFLAFATPRPPYETLRDNEAMRRLVIDAFAGMAKWEVPRMVEALREAPDAFCDSVSQIRMDQWSKGRVALVGDAAHAPSFLSGQGTALSLVTSYVLASELALDGDHRRAFTSYRQIVADFVEQNRRIADRNNAVCVSSARALGMRNAMLRYVAPILIRLRLAHRMGGKTRRATTALTLPAYPLSPYGDDQLKGAAR